MFQFELHFPYFALKEGPPKQESDPKAPKKWIDLSFLETDESHGGTTYGLYQAQFSVVIYGMNETRWTAYAFENNHFDERFENDLEEEEYSSLDFQEDPIAGELDANMPITNPRVYFLRIFRARISQILQFWGDVIGHIDDRVRDHV